MYPEAPGLEPQNARESLPLPSEAPIDLKRLRDGERQYVAYFAEYSAEFTLPVCNWE